MWSATKGFVDIMTEYPICKCNILATFEICYFLYWVNMLYEERKISLPDLRFSEKQKQNYYAKKNKKVFLSFDFISGRESFCGEIKKVVVNFF